MTPPVSAEYVETMLQVAARDASIGRVLQEICHLPGPVRSMALDLVAAQLRQRLAGGQVSGADVFDCIAALRRDEVARTIAERLGPAG